MKKAILFDLDNTLYPYPPSHEAGMEASSAFAASTLNLSREAFRRLYEASREEVHEGLKGTASSHNRILYFQRMYEKCGRSAEPSALLQLHRIYWQAYFSKMVLFEGVLDLFDFLKRRRCRIAIITDMTTQIQMEKLKILNLSPYVGVLVTSEEAGVEKPHPRIFHLALEKLGVPAQDVFLVGDDPEADIAGAERVGIEAIQWIPDGATGTPRGGLPPRHRVSTYRQLKELLEET